MSSISGSEKKLLGPYLDLSYKLGVFAGQLTENAIKAITIEYEGAVMNMFGSKGNYLNPHEGVEATKKLISKYI